nr:MgtC/SapB family protein [Sphingomonas sp. PP-F2F-G114-C0414]
MGCPALTITFASLATVFVLGTLIGLEQQGRPRTAGLRINVLVAVGAAAFADLGLRTAGQAQEKRCTASTSYVPSSRSRWHATFSTTRSSCNTIRRARSRRWRSVRRTRCDPPADQRAGYRTGRQLSLIWVGARGSSLAG